MKPKLSFLFPIAKRNHLKVLPVDVQLSGQNFVRVMIRAQPIPALNP